MRGAYLATFKYFESNAESRTPTCSHIECYLSVICSKACVSLRRMLSLLHCKAHSLTDPALMQAIFRSLKAFHALYLMLSAAGLCL